MRWPLSGRGEGAPRADDEPEELFDEAFQKRLEYLALFARRVFAGRTRADRRSSKVGAGIEFADYRRYSAGDDYRQIDWNVYGRVDRLMLRLYEEEEDLFVYILLDCSASMGFGTPEKLTYAKKLAAALAYISLNNLDRVSISAIRDNVSQRLAPTRGKIRIFPIFDFLRPLSASGPTALGDALGAFAAQNKRKGVAVVLSDLYDPVGFEHGINELRFAKFDTHVIQIVDPADAEPDYGGDLELVDAETGEVRSATLTPRLLSRYRRAYAAYMARIEQFCVQKHVALHRLDIRTPPDEAMLRVLRRGGMLV
jgi:uncharacterized protein (DUF58 family)